MKNKVKVNVNGEAILSRVSRMFDNSPMSILLELCQNARRAGAKKVHVDFSKKDRLVLSHDGAPFSEKDFDAMFSLGDTGWDADDTVSEDPAGSGFFIATLFDRIVIRSREDDDIMHQVEVEKDQLIKAGTELFIESVPNMLKAGDNVEIILHGKHDITSSTYGKLANHFPIKVTGYGSMYYRSDVKMDTWEDKSCLIMAEKNKDMALHDSLKHGVRFRIFDKEAFKEEGRCHFQGFFEPGTWNNHYPYFNYHGHYDNTTGDSELNTLVKKVMEGVHKGSEAHKSTILMITPEGDNEIRMVLPGRHSIVRNDAYRQMLGDVKETLCEYVNSMPEHDLSYDVYESLGGADRIDKEASIPKEISDIAPDTLILSGYPEQPGINHMLEQDCGIIFNYSGISRYEGYSWYSAFNIINEDGLRMQVDGVYLADDYEMSPPKEGVTDSIRLIYMEDGDHPENHIVIAEYGIGFWAHWGYGFSGPCFDETTMWRTETVSASHTMAELERYITGIWDAADGDSNYDSAETQQMEFEAELSDALISTFMPEDAVLGKLRNYIQGNSYNFNNFIGMGFNGKDGSYISVDLSSTWKDEGYKQYKEGHPAIALLDDIIKEFDDKDTVTLQMDRIKELRGLI